VRWSACSGSPPASAGADPALGRLDEVDLSLSLSKAESEKRIAKLQQRLLGLRLTMAGLIGDGKLGPPVCVMFEGWDASGKGGAIKRLVAPLDPRHVHVASFAAPSPREKRHHFLWRFWPALPGWGGWTVLDRSWYGRVLVERVEQFATEDEWRRAYGEIVEFERMITAEGMILVKFWLHISSKEQLRRFEERRDNPLKSWKLTDDDWKNRGLRKTYKAAIEDMFEHTDHKHARWHLVAAESKHYARVRVIETVIEEIEHTLGGHGIDVPPS
jgi:polyphosphate kinase 2 (PPK2 family)